MKKAKLQDGTEVFCIQRPEAITLDYHVSGYLEHGIEVSDGDVIFDVGANIGLFGLRMTQKYPAVTVHAFEPIPSIFEVLEANAKRYGPGRFHTYNCGVSNEPGRLKFTYFPNSPALSTSNPEMWDEDPEALVRAVKGTKRNPPPQLGWMKLIPDFMNGMVAKHLRKGAIQVDCDLQTLSEVIRMREVEKVDVLKIDCEGAELAVLQGIEDEHWPLIAKVVVEIHDKDGRVEIIRKMLESHGISQITVEKEAALEETALVNLYAIRP